MHRIDGPGATVDNRFTDGDPVGGVQATIVTDDWANDVQEELISVLAAASITPVKGTQDQLLKAIRAVAGGAIGVSLNVKMSVSTPSASATLTADQIVVGTSLSGQTYRLASLNKAINLASTGAGGMDTGTAPASGFVGIYVIYNPQTSTSALLAVNASSAAVTEVYSGANMPSGYTASVLISVLPTTSGGLLAALFQADRQVIISPVNCLTTTLAAGSFTALTLNQGIPFNARRANVTWQLSSAGSSTLNFGIASTAAGIFSTQPFAGGTNLTASGGCIDIPLVTARTVYYTFSAASGATLSVFAAGYNF